MIKSVLTETRVTEIKSFLSGAIAEKNIEKKSIDIIVRVEKEYVDSEFVVATICKIDGVLSITARTKRGKRKEYKTIRGVVNFLSMEYGSCNTKEHIEIMMNELSNEIEEKKNSCNDVNSMNMGKLKVMKELIEKMELETEEMLEKFKEEKIKLGISGANEIVNYIENILNNLNGIIVVELKENNKNLILKNDKEGRFALIKHKIDSKHNAPSQYTMISSEEKSYGKIWMGCYGYFEVRKRTRSLDKFIRKEHYKFEEDDYINIVNFYVSNKNKINDIIEERFEEIFRKKMQHLIDKVSNEKDFIEKMNSFICK